MIDEGSFNMDKDIVVLLRHKEPGSFGPAECYACGEWGCRNKYGTYIPCYCEEENCDCDNECGCNCHTWEIIVQEAADNIEKLRILGTQLANAVNYYLSSGQKATEDVLELLDAWKEACRG